LDGVIQDPAGDEGFRVGGWVGRIMDRKELAKVTLDEALGTEALLLGRRSYEWFAARWPSRSGELADRLNSLPKYVVSSTLEHPAWNNSTVLKGDVANEVSNLKQELNGEINVPASFQLVRTLMEHDLVDELRLKIYPVVLGAGERLFGEISDKRPMRLVNIRTIDSDRLRHLQACPRRPAGVGRRQRSRKVGRRSPPGGHRGGRLKSRNSGKAASRSGARASTPQTRRRFLTTRRGKRVNSSDPPLLRSDELLQHLDRDR